jgi:hypothetical protein
VCSEQHLPLVIANADMLKASGFDEMLAMTSNDPWTLNTWAVRLDPRANCGLYPTATWISPDKPESYAGRPIFASKNGAAIHHDRARWVEKLHVERNILSVACTRDAALVDLGQR